MSKIRIFYIDFSWQLEIGNEQNRYHYLNQTIPLYRDVLGITASNFGGKLTSLEPENGTPL